MNQIIEHEIGTKFPILCTEDNISFTFISDTILPQEDKRTLNDMRNIVHQTIEVCNYMSDFSTQDAKYIFCHQCAKVYNTFLQYRIELKRICDVITNGYFVISTSKFPSFSWYRNLPPNDKCIGSFWLEEIMIERCLILCCYYASIVGAQADKWFIKMAGHVSGCTLLIKKWDNEISHFIAKYRIKAINSNRDYIVPKELSNYWTHFLFEVIKKGPYQYKINELVTQIKESNTIIIKMRDVTEISSHEGLISYIGTSSDIPIISPYENIACIFITLEEEFQKLINMVREAPQPEGIVTFDPEKTLFNKKLYVQKSRIPNSVVSNLSDTSYGFQLNAYYQKSLSFVMHQKSWYIYNTWLMRGFGIFMTQRLPPGVINATAQIRAISLGLAMCELCIPAELRKCLTSDLVADASDIPNIPPNESTINEAKKRIELINVHVEEHGAHSDVKHVSIQELKTLGLL